MLSLFTVATHVAAIASALGQSENFVLPHQSAQVTKTNFTCNDTEWPCGQGENIPSFQLSLLNNLTSNVSLSAFITGFDQEGRLKALNPAGYWVYPHAESQSTPSVLSNDLCIALGGSQSITHLQIPGPLVSGRVWIARGPFQLSLILTKDGTTTLVQPSPIELTTTTPDATWGFIELAYDQAAKLTVNLSYVDFVGLLLRLMLLNTDGSKQHAYGLASGATMEICDALEKQSRIDGEPWAELCIYNGEQRPRRILSPNMLISTNSSAFSGYWSSYISDVWDRYSTQPLLFDTQSAAGIVSCSADQEYLWCQSESFSQPSSADIFSCNTGPFAINASDALIRKAIVARLCAAINRSTLLDGGGNIQPGTNSSVFYLSTPTNYYSKLVHQYEVQNIGYAFPYDDVSAHQEVDQANVLTSLSPQILTVLIEDM